MFLYKVTLLCSWICSSLALNMSFPPCFKFGVATAAYQIEGAWDYADKGESIWDYFTHKNPDSIADKSNGDRACDSYRYWKRDVEMVKELNADFYRFSISWPRILPTGYDNYISEEGKNYYSNLIDELLRKGIEPVVTLYHWDLPKSIQDIGGWTNPLIVNIFRDYAKVIFTLFGDRVKTWITINEPLVICDVAYHTGSIAPGIYESIYAPFLCIRHVILAHASAYRLYHSQFSSKNDVSAKGKVSIANHLIYFYPQSERDQEMTDLVMEFVNGRYLHPIFSKEGGWPKTIENLIRKSSEKQGFNYPRLQGFTEDEIEFVRGTYDYLPFNYYTSRIVRAPSMSDISLGYLVQIPELEAALLEPSNATTGYIKLQAVFPEGLRGILAWMKKSYGEMDFFISENGYSSKGYNLKDGERIKYIQDHLKQVLISMKEDGTHVSAYTYWSLLDNFEWAEGFLPKFGLYETNYRDVNLSRTPRDSARYYAAIIKNRTLVIN